MHNNSINATNLPYVFYFNPVDMTFSTRVCIAECPLNNSLPNPATAICDYGVVLNGTTDIEKTASLYGLIATGECAPILYASTPVLGRCVPSVLAAVVGDLSQFVNDTNNGTIANTTAVLNNTLGPDAAAAASVALSAKSVFLNMVQDVLLTWQTILICGGIAIVGAILYVAILRLFAAIFVYVVIIAFEAGLAFLTYWLYFQWRYFANLNSAVTTPTVEMTALQYTMMSLFILVAAILAVVTVILIFSRKRIKIAIAVLKEASKAVAAMPLIFFFPIFVIAAMLALCAFTGYTEAYLSTAQLSNVSVPELGLNLSDPNFSIYAQFFLLLGFLWTWQFLNGVLMTTIAGAVATWYFTRDKRKMGATPVFSSFLRVCIYHLGSIAFGSLIIALVQLVRYILTYIQKKLGKKNKTLQIILCCCICLVWCFEKILKYITRRAYIEIAIHGRSFCASARAAFLIMVTNALRLAIVDSISMFILTLGKLLIAGAIGVLNYYYYYQNVQIHFWWVPAVLSAIAAWIVTSYFLYTYEMAIDTIFLCFCHDVEDNNGSSEKPYYMSRELMDIGILSAAFVMVTRVSQCAQHYAAAKLGPEQHLHCAHLRCEIKEVAHAIPRHRHCMRIGLAFAQIYPAHPLHRILQ